MKKYISLLLIIIRAIFYRIRGSAHPYPDNLGANPNPTFNDTVSRLGLHAIPDGLTVMALCYFSQLPLWLAAISCFLSFGTLAWIGHSQYQGNTVLSYLGMTAVLSIRIASVYAPVAIYSQDWHYMIPAAESLLVFPLCWLSYEAFMQQKLTIKIGKFVLPLVYTIPSSEPQELLIGADIGAVGATEFIWLL